MGFRGGSDGKEFTAMQETWVQPLGWEDPLEKGMATHSSILAWRIPWTEETGGLWFMGWQRVIQDWATKTHVGFPGGAVVKNPPASTGDIRDTGSIPGSWRSPGEGNGYRLHYFCVGTPIDIGTWQATVHGVTKSWTQLSNFTHTNTYTHI